MKKLAILFFALFLAVPAFAGAETTQDQIAELMMQIAKLQEQIKSLQAQSGIVASLQTSTNTCINLSRSLYMGVKGDEVTSLQKYLSSVPNVYPEKLVTGYYGPATTKAVAAFQAANGIMQTGTVGPITKAKIATLSCVSGGTTTNTGTTIAPATNLPTVNEGAAEQFSVIQPINGTYYSDQTLDVSWKPFSGGFDYYYVMLGNKVNGHTHTLTPDTNVSKTATLLKVSSDNLSGILREMLSNSGGYTADQLENDYFIQVIAMKRDAYGYENKAGQTEGGKFSIITRESGTNIGNPEIHLTSQTENEEWRIGSNQTVSWTVENMPSGAVLGVYIYGVGGGFEYASSVRANTLFFVANPSLNISKTFVVPESVFQNDNGHPLEAGTYRLEAKLFDQQPCLSACYPPRDVKTYSQDESDGIITISKESVLGDVNSDGKIDLTDVVLVNGYVAGTATLGDSSKADVDADGAVDSVDVTILRKVVLGTIAASDLPIKWGDLNVDGSISLVDVATLQKYINGEITLSSKLKVAADVYADGVINDQDLAILRKFILGTQTSLPVVVTL